MKLKSTACHDHTNWSNWDIKWI